MQNPGSDSVSATSDDASQPAPSTTLTLETMAPQSFPFSLGAFNTFYQEARSTRYTWIHTCVHSRKAYCRTDILSAQPASISFLRDPSSSICAGLSPAYSVLRDCYLGQIGSRWARIVGSHDYSKVLWGNKLLGLFHRLCFPTLDPGMGRNWSQYSLWHTFGFPTIDRILSATPFNLRLYAALIDHSRWIERRRFLAVILP